MNLDQFFIGEYGRLMGALVGQFRDFDLAEDALQEAILAAINHSKDLEQGPSEKLFGWVLLTARRKAIDILRRESNGRYKSASLVTRQAAFFSEEDAADLEGYQRMDEKLRLLFTCCHPALSRQAQIALTLKFVAGFRVSEIASAFLMKEATVAQTLTRAKHKIREAGIPFAVLNAENPDPRRLDGVLAILYLIFNEGYLSSEHNVAIRTDLCEDAISLAHELSLSFVDSAEVFGLLALMLFHHARKAARLDENEELIRLEEQDPALFDREIIQAAERNFTRSYQIKPGGFYQTLAYIAAIHARVVDPQIDWEKIVFLYEQILNDYPTPFFQLNYAVALANAGRQAQSQEILFDPELQSALSKYPYYHLACAASHEHRGQPERAAAEYQQALALTRSAREHKFISAKIAGLIE